MKKMVLTVITGLLAAGVPSGWASESQALVYLTAKDTDLRLAKGEPMSLVDMAQPADNQNFVFVDPSATFQSVVGIGGAMTDASAETFYKMPSDKQKEILTAYYDPREGIGYSLGRTHIHSCDFSSESYTYAQAGDKELKSFDISHDLKYRVPFIKAAAALAGKDFSLYISPWSPPGWMKSNNDMLRGGKLKPEAYGCWADYYTKFIKAYEKEGIPIWGLTVQNEPAAVQSWESCIYTAEEERDFVKNHLGPALKKAGQGDKKLMIWDHNRDLMFQRASAVLDDPAAAKYVWGVGFHWYVGDHFENVRRVQERYPETHLLFTEGCAERFNAQKFNDWQWGEMYGKSMINDFNNGAVGWTDWNVLLDERGGPNHVGNFCYAPIHGDTKSGKVSYMNSYYYIGHFSKFIRPGARRITSSSTSDDLLSTAFLNKDGKMAVIVMNSTDRDQSFYLWVKGKAGKAKSPHHSITTLLVEK